MATLSRLVETIAAVEGIDPERVGAIARVVREAGLIATRGRGPSAADMSETDAANLLIAVNVAETARTAPEMVTRYRLLQASKKALETTFGAELENLLSAVRTQKVADVVVGLVRFVPERSSLAWNKYSSRQYDFRIEFRKPNPEVTLFVRGPWKSNVDCISFAQPDKSSSTVNMDREEVITITERTIFAIGALLRD